MTVLVAGGAGFIGRTLTRTLVQEGHEVRILDNLSLSTENLVPTDPNIHFYRGDLRDLDTLLTCMRDCDVVYHLAAPSSVIMFEEDPLNITSSSVAGFLNLMEAARLRDVEKIVYASTAAVYEGQELPYREDMILPRPVDLKALSKKFLEDLVELYCIRYGLSAAAMRPFSVFGPGDESKHRYANVTTLFVSAMASGRRPEVWGDGNQTRDFIFVDDVARAFILASERKWKNEAFNVGTGIETSFNQIVTVINEMLGTSIEPEYVPVKLPVYARRLKADTRKSQAMLNFRPKFTLKDGMARILGSQRAVAKG